MFIQNSILVCMDHYIHCYLSIFCKVEVLCVSTYPLIALESKDIIQILSFDICWNISFLWNTFQDDKPKEIAIYQTVCENMPDPKVLCRLVDLISTRISMSPDPVTVVSR
jgi:hypothetical protein